MTESLEEKSNRRSPLFWLRISGAVMVLVACVGWLSPQARVWGVHHLAFLPFVVSLCLVVGAGLMLLPLGNRIIARTMLSGQRLANLSPYLWVAVAVVLSFGVREREPLLGDGQALLRHLETIGRLEARFLPTYNVADTRWTEPLETWMHENAYRVVALMHPPVSGTFSPDQEESEIAAEKVWFFESARWTYVALSITAGAVFVLLTIRFARKMLAPELRAVFLGAVYMASGMLLFFGYIEDYVWTSLALSATLLFGIEESADEKPWPRWTLLCFAAAVAFHLLSLVLLPAIIFLVLMKRYGNEEWVKRISRWPLGIIAATGCVAVYVLFSLNTKIMHVLPLLPSAAKDGYALLAPEHLLDLLNVLLLCAALPIAVVLFVRGRKSIAERFLGIAAICGVAFVVFFDPDIGAPVDWDLCAAALWPLVFLGAWKLANAAAGWNRAEVLSIITAFALVIPAPYILLNTRTESQTARLETILPMVPPYRASYDWENLSAHYRRAGNPERAIVMLRRALAGNPAPRYKLNLASHLRRAGQLAEAESLYVEAAHAAPMYAKFMLPLCKSYAERGDNAKVLQLAETMVALDPGNPVLTKLLSDLQRTAGK